MGHAHSRGAATRAEPPETADVVVIGSGAGGAPAAARLAENGARVVLLEAGPDYGPFSRDAWPHDLLDASSITDSHDWGHSSERQISGRVIAFERARVLGGCTAHNGAIQIRGHREDYDNWVALGNPGWDTASMQQRFEAAEERLGVWTYAVDDLTPFQRSLLEGAPSAGLPILETINDLDEDIGAAPETVNIRDGVRWNAAFAYLDPVRHLTNLTIYGDALVDRLVIRGGRAIGVRLSTPSGRRTIAAGTIVLAAGAYGTPAILQRSGVGPPDVLRSAGVDLLIAAPVGENLHDQAFISIELAGSDALQAAMTGFAKERGWAPDEQVIMKARSAMADSAFDVHVFPWSPPGPRGRRRWFIGGACLTPRSRGVVAIHSGDPERQPRIDNAFLSDAEGYDIGALRWLLDLFRELAATPSARALIGPEIGASAQARDASSIDAFLRSTVSHYWHPQGSCRMGPDHDPGAVCTPRGAVRGLENVLVADAALIPEAPRGFPMLPTIAIAENVSQWLIEDSP
ncbi:MAG: choline dehydrogenase [Gaiellales bacterium]|nr:choline dehydrogenase [Gaiellales bacterium]